MQRKKIFYVLTLSLSLFSTAIFAAPIKTIPSTTSKKLKTNGEILQYVDDSAKKIIIEELARLGIANLINIKHALDYFKALQKEFLITQYNEAMEKVRKKAIEDLRLYFYLSPEQIKNMVFIMLTPYLETIKKNIR